MFAPPCSNSIRERFEDALQASSSVDDFSNFKSVKNASCKTPYEEAYGLHVHVEYFGRCLQKVPGAEQSPSAIVPSSGILNFLKFEAELLFTACASFSSKWTFYNALVWLSAWAGVKTPRVEPCRNSRDYGKNTLSFSISFCWLFLFKNNKKAGVVFQKNTNCYHFHT